MYAINISINIKFPLYIYEQVDEKNHDRSQYPAGTS